MADEKKERWLNWLALTTVILAVCATFSTFKGGGFSSRSMMSQVQASDQWSFYQAKGIKAYLYELQRDQFKLELSALAPGAAGEVAAGFKDKIAQYEGKLADYDKEKKEIKAKAEELESIRDEAGKHSRAFGSAIIFLQIAILLSSIAALLKKPLVWAGGLVCGVVGVVYFVNGFLLFLPPWAG